jgi:hypothetical protein
VKYNVFKERDNTVYCFGHPIGLDLPEMLSPTALIWHFEFEGARVETAWTLLLDLPFNPYYTAVNYPLEQL